MTNKNTELATVNTQHSAIEQFSQTDIDIIKNSVAKGTSDQELKYFLAVAASTGLNPFQKEIWCYKSGNDMLIFAGRDGFLANAQKKSDFKGLRSGAVYENDKFNMNIPSGHIEHTFGAANRGKIVGAYAIVKRENMDSFIEWAGFDEYNKGRNTWSTNPASMIIKVAEAHALKKAYSLNGVNSEHDYDFNRNTFATPEPEEATYLIDDKQLSAVPEEVLTAIEDAKTVEEVTAIYNDKTELRGNPNFMKALSARKLAIKEELKAAPNPA